MFQVLTCLDIASVFIGVFLRLQRRLVLFLFVCYLVSRCQHISTTKRARLPNANARQNIDTGPFCKTWSTFNENIFKIIYFLQYPCMASTVKLRLGEDCGSGKQKLNRKQLQYSLLIDNRLQYTPHSFLSKIFSNI